MTTGRDQHIIFFDSHCTLCSGWVQFLIRRDQYKQFTFHSLDSDIARNLIGKQVTDNNTVYYYRNGTIYHKSSAAILILSDLGGVWQAIRYLQIIPPPIRDLLYDFCAKHRHLLR